MDAEAPQRFRLLFVCTGNLCRSPMAELMLRSRVQDSSCLSIASAGTVAPQGAPMDPASASALWQFGVSSDGFAATRLDRDLIDAADLILCMARVHRAAVARLAPASTRRAFALTEFCRLAAGITPGDGSIGGAHRLVASVRAQRGLVPPVPGEADDIVDPIQKPRAVVEACAQQIFGLIDQLSVLLGLHR